LTAQTGRKKRRPPMANRSAPKKNPREEGDPVLAEIEATVSGLVESFRDYLVLLIRLARPADYVAGHRQAEAAIEETRETRDVAPEGTARSLTETTKERTVECPVPIPGGREGTGEGIQAGDG
jgi:hypothetical protein